MPLHWLGPPFLPECVQIPAWVLWTRRMRCFWNRVTLLVRSHLPHVWPVINTSTPTPRLSVLL